MRAILLSLGICSAAGCAASGTSGPELGADVEAVSEAFVIPAPPASPTPNLNGMAATEKRTIPFDGAYRAQFTLQSSHGCSQSWATSTTTGQASLQVARAVATLELDADERHQSGSRMNPGPTHETESKTHARYRGTVETTEEGFSAHLVRVGCEDGEACKDTLDLRCSRARIPLGVPGHADAPVAAGGVIAGVECEGLESVVSSLGSTAVPLGAGSGVRIEADAFGRGGGGRQVFAAGGAPKH